MDPAAKTPFSSWFRCAEGCDFRAALTEVVSDPDRAAAMGRAGRQRAIDAFSWAAIAEQTLEVYRSAR